MIGPLFGTEDCGAHCCTWGLILGISLFFIILSFNKLYNDYFYFLLMYLISLFLLSFCLCATTCTDPGIIPRRAILELKKDYPSCYVTGK